MSAWPSVVFDRSEFACACGCGFDTVDAELLMALGMLRHYFASPVRINSACRCQGHNRRVGGEPNSLHMLGKAADVVVIGHKASEVQAYLEANYPEHYGIGRYERFTHLDVRKKPARWVG